MADVDYEGDDVEAEKVEKKDDAENGDTDEIRDRDRDDSRDRDRRDRDKDRDDSRERDRRDRDRNRDDSRDRDRDRDRDRPRGPPPDVDKMYTLKVDNLSFDTNADVLKDKFGKYGEVGDVYIPRDRYSQKPRGFAFVRFIDKRDAEDAMDAMDSKDLDGREIRVQFARHDRPKHGRGGGRYRDDRRDRYRDDRRDRYRDDRRDRYRDDRRDRYRDDRDRRR
mmetsp:Transcript_13619/g.17688  ORF Transcript_13619/g.17688 Transcript_13619/m.17688 type:complete len:222 (+) Transcript_13619:144-809(+)